MHAKLRFKIQQLKISPKLHTVSHQRPKVVKQGIIAASDHYNQICRWCLRSKENNDILTGNTLDLESECCKADIYFHLSWKFKFRLQYLLIKKRTNQVKIEVASNVKTTTAYLHLKNWCFSFVG